MHRHFPDGVWCVVLNTFPACGGNKEKHSQGSLCHAFIKSTRTSAFRQRQADPCPYLVHGDGLWKSSTSILEVTTPPEDCSLTSLVSYSSPVDVLEMPTLLSQAWPHFWATSPLLSASYDSQCLIARPPRVRCGQTETVFSEMRPLSSCCAPGAVLGKSRWFIK